jgi:hypothetical protein
MHYSKRRKDLIPLEMHLLHQQKQQCKRSAEQVGLEWENT